MVKQVTICYCCEWFLQATRGNHLCLPQVGGQKRKPLIDGTYKVRKLHIYGKYFLTHYHLQMKVSSCVFAIIFMWICHLCHSVMSQNSCGFAVYFAGGEDGGEGRRGRLQSVFCGLQQTPAPQLEDQIGRRQLCTEFRNLRFTPF